MTVRTRDDDGKLLDQSEWRVQLTALDPSWCFPFWDAATPGKMSSIMLQFPVYDSNVGKTVTFSMYVTPDTWTTWTDAKQTAKSKNIFGKLNVVHIPNFIRPKSSFGLSDIEDVIPLNEEYNLVSNSVRKIVKYQGEPTTLIFGARASTLERGANKVWSNLPTDARVENLELKTDLKAVRDYLNELKANIQFLSDTPKVVFDSSELSVSNTSGLAMQMMFLPLISKTERRRVAHRKGIQEINRLIFQAHRDVLGENWVELSDDPKTAEVTNVEYTSLLPKDEQMELDIALKKVAAGVWSKAEFARRISGVVDLERLALELAADKRSEMALAYENQRSLNGLVPNLASVFLSSVYLSEDLESVAKESAAVEKSDK